MRVTGFAACVLLSGLIVTSMPLAAQTLGDLARKEDERRKAVPQAGKVYTNKDLGPVLPPPPSPPLPEAKAADTNADAPKGPKSPKGNDAPVEAKEKPVVKDQTYWAERKKTLQGQLDRDQTFADALQSRINALTTDFVNRSDPAQRAVIERDRQKALAELANLKKQIEDDKKALAGLEEEARRAGVPPGWLR
jgi:hypothetical protein